MQAPVKDVDQPPAPPTPSLTTPPPLPRVAGRGERTRLADLRLSRTRQLVSVRVSRTRQLIANRRIQAQQLALAQIIISICCLPLPVMAILASLVRPGFVTDVESRQAAINSATAPYITFVTFATILLLVGYHALMFWYNPFAVDSRVVQRKRRIINGISFVLSIPIVSALIVTTLGTKKSFDPIFQVLLAITHHFPLYPTMLILLVVALLGWAIWFVIDRAYVELPTVQKVETQAFDFWRWLRKKQFWLGVWFRRWRGKLFFFILTFVLLTSLLSEMVQTLGLGVGFVPALALGLVELTAIEICVALAFTRLNRRGFGWLVAAWWGVEGGMQELVKDSVNLREDIPAALTYILEIEMIAGLVFLGFWLFLTIRDWLRQRRARRMLAATVSHP